MKYEKLSKELISALGGKKNITSLTHCMTRLRFTLKDESKANDELIEAIEGVVSLIKKAGQYQVVIGTHVADVFAEVCKQADIKEEKKEETSKQGFLSNLLGSIISVVGPLIPILIATGLGKCILLVVSMMGWATAETSFAYYIFNFVFDAGFTFMPVFVAINAAKHFNCNVMIAALLACSLVHPNWNAVAQTAPQVIGEFWMIPVYGIKYTSTLIPAMGLVWVMAKLELFLKKYIPELLKGLLVPLLTVLIMVPVSFIVVAPLMGILSIFMGDALLWVYDTFGLIGLAIMNIVYPWIVATGTHAPLALAGIQMISDIGYDPFSRTLTLTANAAQGTAAIACAIKTKNKDFRNNALSAAFTAFFAGITEPCIYGVSLRLKRPMYAVMIGCGFGALYAGFVGLKAYAFMTPSILNFAMWIDQGSNLMHAGITTLVTVVVTFIATWVLGFEDPIEKKVESVEHKLNTLDAPVEGEVIDLSLVKDEAFSSEKLGKGIAIIPTNGKVVAPVDCKVSAVFPTKHAIGLTTVDGTEVLIHVGIDTVKLGGKHFSQLVNQGEFVAKGTTLIEFDLKALKNEGIDTTTMVVITNSNNYLEVIPTNEKLVKGNSKLITII